MADIPDTLLAGYQTFMSEHFASETARYKELAEKVRRQKLWSLPAAIPRRSGNNFQHRTGRNLRIAQCCQSYSTL